MLLDVIDAFPRIHCDPGFSRSDFGQVIYGATYGYATHNPFRFGQIIYGAIRSSPHGGELS